jgi:hypothetical protein
LVENAKDGKPVIYVISEREHLALLPAACVRVLVIAELDEIQARFAKRMGGYLPAPVAAMLEHRHGIFDREPHDVLVASGQGSIDNACDEILARMQ